MLKYSFRFSIFFSHNYSMNSLLQIIKHMYTNIWPTNYTVPDQLDVVRDDLNSYLYCQIVLQQNHVRAKQLKLKKWPVW